MWSESEREGEGRGEGLVTERFIKDVIKQIDRMPDTMKKKNCELECMVLIMRKGKLK